MHQFWTVPLVVCIVNNLRGINQGKTSNDLFASNGNAAIYEGAVSLEEEQYLGRLVKSHVCGLGDKHPVAETGERSDYLP